MERHGLRVFLTADRLATAREAKVDREVLLIAGLLHDIGLYDEASHGGVYVREGAEFTADLLQADLSSGLVSFGLTREWLHDLFESVPRDGTYGTIGRDVGKQLLNRPLKFAHRSSGADPYRGRLNTAHWPYSGFTFIGEDHRGWQVPTSGVDFRAAHGQTTPMKLEEAVGGRKLARTPVVDSSMAEGTPSAG